MRLWHQDLLLKLPQKQLSGQWRECIALLGKGWGKNHKTVNYVFSHTKYALVLFTHYVYKESKRRGYNFDYSLMGKALYRGSFGNSSQRREILKQAREASLLRTNRIKIYDEHNELYLEECLENLKSKGILIQ